MRVAIITASTEVYREKEEDRSGELLKSYLQEESDCEVVFMKALPNDREVIGTVLQRMADGALADLVLTTGGAGCNPEDYTPEATMDVCDRLVPGISEGMRAYTMTKTKRAMLNRGVAGIRKQTLIVNLPGKAKAALSCLKYLLPELDHACAVIGSEDE